MALRFPRPPDRSVRLAAFPGWFTAPLQLGLPLAASLSLCEQQVTVELPQRLEGRTGWLAQDSDMQEGLLGGLFEPREPSKCQPTSLSTWAE